MPRLFSFPLYSISLYCQNPAFFEECRGERESECCSTRNLFFFDLQLEQKQRAFLDYDDSDGHIGSFSPAYGDQYPDIIITDDSYDSSYDLEDIDDMSQTGPKDDDNDEDAYDILSLQVFFVVRLKHYFSCLL